MKIISIFLEQHNVAEKVKKLKRFQNFLKNQIVKTRKKIIGNMSWVREISFLCYRLGDNNRRKKLNKFFLWKWFSTFFPFLTCLLQSRQVEWPLDKKEWKKILTLKKSLSYKTIKSLQIWLRIWMSTKIKKSK